MVIASPVTESFHLHFTPVTNLSLSLSCNHTFVCASNDSGWLGLCRGGGCTGRNNSGESVRLDLLNQSWLVHVESSEAIRDNSCRMMVLAGKLKLAEHTFVFKTHTTADRPPGLRVNQQFVVFLLICIVSEIQISKTDNILYMTAKRFSSDHFLVKVPRQQ